MLKSGCDRFLPSWGRFLRAPLAVWFATAPTKKGPRKGPRTYSIRKRRPSPAHEGGCCREGVRYPDLGSSSACAFPTLSVASCMLRHPYRSGSVPDSHRLPENTLTIRSSDPHENPILTSRARIRQSSQLVNLLPRTRGLFRRNSVGIHGLKVRSNHPFRFGFKATVSPFKTTPGQVVIEVFILFPPADSGPQKPQAREGKLLPLRRNDDFL